MVKFAKLLVVNSRKQNIVYIKKLYIKNNNLISKTSSPSVPPVIPLLFITYSVTSDTGWFGRIWLLYPRVGSKYGQCVSYVSARNVVYLWGCVVGVSSALSRFGHAVACVSYKCTYYNNNVLLLLLL